MREREREREKKDQYKGGKKGKNMYLIIMTLNVDELNSSIIRHRVAEWIRKYDPKICYVQETHLKTKDPYRLKVKGWKKYSMQREMEKKLG